MSASFDIFQVESGGGVRWLEAAETLGDARARVQELVRRSPGEYFVPDAKTGNKIVIQSDGEGASASDHLRFPVWDKPYQEALQEGDAANLAAKVTAAEAAIFQRLQELGNSSDGHSETMAIEIALNALLAIKNEKLNWQRLFQGVLTEHRPQERSSKIQAAEAAIYVRLQALAHDSRDQSERQALADAMSTLRMLQQKKMSKARELMEEQRIPSAARRQLVMDTPGRRPPSERRSPRRGTASSLLRQRFQPAAAHDSEPRSSP